MLSKEKNYWLLVSGLALFFFIIMPFLEILSSGIFPLFARLDFIFHTQRTYLILGLFVIIFGIISVKHVKKLKKIIPSIPLIALGILILGIAATNQIDFYDALESDLVIVHDDFIEWGYGGPIGVRWPVGRTELTSNTVARRIIYLENIPENPELYVYLGKQPVQSDPVSVIVKVNNKSYNITQDFSQLAPYSIRKITIDLDNNVLKSGDNTIDIISDGSTAILARQFYYHRKTLISRSNEDFEIDDGASLIGIQRIVEIPFWRQATFLFKPYLIFLGGIILLIGIIGLKSSNHLFKKRKLELSAAAVLSIGFFGILQLSESIWQYLAIGALQITNLIGFTIGLDITTSFSVTSCQNLGLKELVLTVCRSSSGYESFSLFALLSLIILVTNWHEIQLKKALLLFIVGLAGTVIINGFRIFIMLVIGAFYSPELALGTVHTNLGWILFLSYSAAVWIFALNWLSKK